MTGLRAKQKAQRRSLIEDAAGELFEEKGFDVTTIEEIAERALVSPATVYNYYGTKGELLLSLIARGEEATIEKLDEYVKKADIEEPEDLISEIICANVKDTLSYLSRSLWGHVVAYVATTNDPDVAPRYLSTIADNLSKAIEVALARYVERGVLRPINVSELAYLFTRLERNHFLGYVYLKSMTQEEFKRAIAKDVALLIGGLKA